MKLKYAYGIVTGTSRVEQGIECQDKINTIHENGVVGIVLADGAGRKVNSGFCAAIVVDAATNLIRDRFDELFSAGEERTKQIIIKSVMKELGKTELALISMASTLSFVAVKGRHYLAGNIGHGVIISRNESCSVLLKPQAGSFGNETNFITDLDAIDKLQIDKGDLQEPFGFMLLSDGAGHSLYEANAGSLSSACATLFQWLDEYDAETVGEALTENINKYFTKNTEDDITVAMMVSDETEPDEEFAKEEANKEEPYIEEANAQEMIDPPENTEIKNTDRRSKLRKNGILALIMIVVAVSVCVAISPSLSWNMKDHNDMTNQDQLINKDGTAKESLANKEVLKNEEPPKNEDRSEGENPIVKEEEDTLAAFYPAVTYTAENPEFFPAGEYEAGIDIPAGEYFFYTGELLMPDSITINEESCLSGELYCMNIQLEAGDTLISSCAFTASENVNPMQFVQGVLINGKYKIGKDIAPGKYIAMSIVKEYKGKYYSIRNGNISNDTAYRHAETVTVPEEGYIVLYNSAIASDEEDLERAADDWNSGS